MYVDEQAETLDLTTYINEHLDKGEIRVTGRLSNEEAYTRIHFDSKRIEDKDATLCSSVKTELKPFLGVASSGMEDFSGVLLEQVITNSAAEKANLHSGDVISYINNREIRSICDLRSAVNKLEIGKEAAITFNSGNANHTKNVVIGSRVNKRISWSICEAQVEPSIAISETEIKAVTPKYDYEVFPNPSVGLSTLTFKHDGTGELSITIFDLNGKKVYIQDKVDFEGYYEEQINISNQPSGLYIVELDFNGKKFTKELTITTVSYTHLTLPTTPYV